MKEETLKGADGVSIFHAVVATGRSSARDRSDSSRIQFTQWLFQVGG